MAGSSPAMTFLLLGPSPPAARHPPRAGAGSGLHIPKVTYALSHHAHRRSILIGPRANVSRRHGRISSPGIMSDQVIVGALASILCIVIHAAMTLAVVRFARRLATTMVRYPLLLLV